MSDSRSLVRRPNIGIANTSELSSQLLVRGLDRLEAMSSVALSSAALAGYGQSLFLWTGGDSSRPITTHEFGLGGEFIRATSLHLLDVGDQIEHDIHHLFVRDKVFIVVGYLKPPSDHEEFFRSSQIVYVFSRNGTLLSASVDHGALDPIEPLLDGDLEGKFVAHSAFYNIAGASNDVLWPTAKLSMVRSVGFSEVLRAITHNFEPIGPLICLDDYVRPTLASQDQGVLYMLDMYPHSDPWRQWVCQEHTEAFHVYSMSGDKGLESRFKMRKTFAVDEGLVYPDLASTVTTATVSWTTWGRDICFIGRSWSATSQDGMRYSSGLRVLRVEETRDGFKKHRTFRLEGESQDVPGLRSLTPILVEGRLYSRAGWLDSSGQLEHRPTILIHNLNGQLAGQFEPHIPRE